MSVSLPRYPDEDPNQTRAYRLQPGCRLSYMLSGERQSNRNHGCWWCWKGKWKIYQQLRSPVREAFSNGTDNCDSVKHKVMLHGITMNYAISRMKISHVQDCTICQWLWSFVVPVSQNWWSPTPCVNSQVWLPVVSHLFPLCFELQSLKKVLGTY